MKFVDLNFENKEAVKKSRSAFKEIEKSGKYLLGEFLEKFEVEFAKDQNVDHVSCVKNATDALYMVFKLLDCHERTIIIPEFGAYPTSIAAIQAGAQKIIAAPVDKRLTLDLTNIDVPKDSIIVPVHLFGNQAEMTHISRIAKDTNSIIIEDCAQSTGIEKSEFSFAAIHSFYPTKPLGCRGDGGAIISNDFSFIEKCKKARFYGLNEGKVSGWGFNSRMDEWQSAFLLEKIKYYRTNNLIRIKNSREILDNVTPGVEYTKNCVFHQLVVICNNRDETISQLSKNNIPTMIHYPKMLRDMPHLQDKIVFTLSNLRISDKILSLPVGPHLKKNEIMKISKTIKRFLT